VTFEWYTTKYNNTINYAHFLVTFYEALPSWVTCEYVPYRRYLFAIRKIGTNLAPATSI
jgi:hypothetical protein